MPGPGISECNGDDRAGTVRGRQPAADGWLPSGRDTGADTIADIGADTQLCGWTRHPQRITNTVSDSTADPRPAGPGNRWASAERELAGTKRLLTACPAIVQGTSRALAGQTFQGYIWRHHRLGTQE